MSKFSFAKDVTTIKYISGKDLDFLVNEHGITMEEAMSIMIKLGFDKGYAGPNVTPGVETGEDEYWKGKLE